MARVAVVTGSNKGIGFAIVRKMCKVFDGDVILTSRDEGRGKEAVTKLEGEGLKPLYHQLDITSSDSIEVLRKYLDQKYGGLDVLINNAATAYKSSTTGEYIYTSNMKHYIFYSSVFGTGHSYYSNKFHSHP